MRLLLSALLAILLNSNVHSQQSSFDSLVEKSSELINRGKPDSVFELLSSIDTTQLNKADKLKYLSLSSKAHSVSSHQNSREKAIAYLVEALKLIDTNKESASLQADLNDRIGEIYDLMRQKEPSKIYFERAFDLRKEYKLTGELYKSYINLGINSYRFGKLINSVSFNKKALKEFDGETPKTSVAKSHFWLGSAYNYLIDEKPGNLATFLDSALYHAEIAKNIYVELNDTINIIQANNLLGNIYTQQNNGTEAVNVLSESVELITRLENSSGAKLEQEIYATTFTRLSKAYELVGDFRKALEYSNERYSEVIGILMEKERTRVAQITEDYRTDKQLDEAEEIAFFASRKAKLFGIGLIVLAVILLISYLIFIQTLQKKKLENLQAMIMGEEQERKRVAKDLHDGIGVLLTSVKLRLSNFEDKVEDKKAYQNSLEQIDNACTEVRRISHNMVPASLTKLGLEEATLDLLDNVRAATNLEIKEDIRVEEGIIQEGKEVLIYRIIQEMINNCLKYAEAKSLSLILKMNSNNLSLVYQDDGKGFNKNDVKEGLGLRSISSRVDILRGKIQIISSPGEGTRFDINIPVNG